MRMVITVVPTGEEKCFREEFKQAFDLEGAFIDTEEAVTRINEEGGLDEILHFLTRCHHRLNRLIGESVILVDFRQREIFPEEEDAPLSLYAPSLN